MSIRSLISHSVNLVPSEWVCRSEEHFGRALLERGDEMMATIKPCPVCGQPMPVTAWCMLTEEDERRLRADVKRLYDRG